MLAQLLRFIVQVALQQRVTVQALLFFSRQEMHAGGVDIDTALDATATGFRHGAPVFEGVGD
ncbi:hypothetical protein D3C71_1451210 [compost metagenome]